MSNDRGELKGPSLKKKEREKIGEGGGICRHSCDIYVYCIIYIYVPCSRIPTETKRVKGKGFYYDFNTCYSRKKKDRSETCLKRVVDG